MPPKLLPQHAQSTASDASRPPYIATPVQSPASATHSLQQQHPRPQMTPGFSADKVGFARSHGFTPPSASTVASRPGSMKQIDRALSSASPTRADTESASTSNIHASSSKAPRTSTASKPSSDDGQNDNSAGNQRNKKTLADVLASQQGLNPPRKRKRAHYSCSECHRRKARCDRNIPCQPCLDRGLGDTCRPFQDGDEFGDERDRLRRLEDLVEGLARAHATLSDEFELYRQGKLAIAAGSVANGGASTASLRLLGEAASSAAAASGASSSADGEDVARTSDRRKSVADKRARLSSRISTFGLEREELQQGGTFNDETGQASLYGGPSAGDVLPESNSLEGGLTREGDSFYGALALPSVSRGVIETQIHGERLELSSNVPLRSASAKVHRLIQEGGAPPSIIDELMSCLPPRHETDAMLEWYFRDINDTRLPLHERTFRASYEEIMQWRWGNLRHEEGDDGARHIPFLAFLFVILAIAKRSEPEDRCASDEEARRGALFYLHCARRSMAIASAVRADHIDVLLAALYGARLLITLRQSAESWSLLGVAIRAAQAIGLHRDGTKLGLDAVTTERRRRLWAMIYYLDRTTSMLLGRPQAIDDKTADTLPPSDVDIDVLPRFGPAPTPQPFPPLASAPSADSEKIRRPPGVFNFVAIRHELAKLIGRIVEHFQDLSKPRNYADVLQIDADLQRFYDSLPGCYLYEALRGEEADRSFDEVCPWLPIHRYLLNIEYTYVRNALHRPYLLRSERYKQSREAAFASAKADRLVRREYEREAQWPSNRARNAHLGGVYRKFASTLMAGIELLLEPNGQHAPELMETLDDFLNSSTKVADPSQCTKRELAIIKIFKAKAMDPSWCAATATGARATVKQVMTTGGVNGRAPLGDVQSASKDANEAAQDAKGAAPPTSAQARGEKGQPLNGSSGENAGALPRLPTSQREKNDLAQTLLDRLGGLESLSVLNQNQSPSSNSVSSLDLSTMTTAAPTTNGMQESVGRGVGMMGQSSQFPGMPGMTSMSQSAPPFSANGLGSEANLTAAYPVSTGPSSSAMTNTNANATFEGLFDTSDGADWFSLDGNTGMAGFNGQLTSMGATTPGGSGGILGGGKDDADFAGWGTLVEAIVSGQDN